MTPASLASLRAVVTGGLGALGRATAAVLVERGARVVLLDRVAAVSVEGVAGVRGEVDLADPAAAAAAMQSAADTLGGGIDALVNLAGGFAWEPIDGGSLATWDRMYAINLRTTMVTCQQALPFLLDSRRASIVNAGALSAAKAASGMGAYAAAKSGVLRLTESLAEELKERGVRVNAVLPTILDTPANRAAMPDADRSRWVAPAALGRVIAFLLSADAQPVSGAALPVGGPA